MLQNELSETEVRLTALNKMIADVEQSASLSEDKSRKADKFFRRLLSDQLVFRRADGEVIGKSGTDGFLERLRKPSPFSSRVAENIKVKILGERALVTLTVVATRNDDQSVHRYRNIRLFSRSGEDWILEFWFNDEIKLNDEIKNP
jgi:hypothetical protein